MFSISLRERCGWKTSETKAPVTDGSRVDEKRSKNK